MIKVIYKVWNSLICDRLEHFFSTFWEPVMIDSQAVVPGKYVSAGKMIDGGFQDGIALFLLFTNSRRIEIQPLKSTLYISYIHKIAKQC